VDCFFQLSELIRMLANVLGMLPENQRQDRNSYIYINNSNIDRRNLANLQPLPDFIIASVYDYASITHAYSKVFFRDVVETRLLETETETETQGSETETVYKKVSHQ